MRWQKGVKNFLPNFAQNQDVSYVFLNAELNAVGIFDPSQSDLPETGKKRVKWVNLVFSSPSAPDRPFTSPKSLNDNQPLFYAREVPRMRRRVS